MATVSYTFVSRCAGGGHTVFDVSLNGGAANRVVYPTDEVRAALSTLTTEERQALALLILKVHLAGKTRAEIVTEFQAGPVTVTI
jgi:hypothetical protein